MSFSVFIGCKASLMLVITSRAVEGMLQGNVWSAAS